MRKRGFMCICLAVIMAVGLLPSLAIASASSDDFYTVWDTSDVGGFRFMVQRSGLVSNDTTQVLSPVLETYTWDSEITITTGTSIRLYYGSFAYFVWGNPEYHFYFRVGPVTRQGDWYMFDFDNRMEWEILPGNIATVTFNTPGRFGLHAHKCGGAAIHVVEGEAPPPPTPEGVVGPSSWAVPYVTRAIDLGLVPQNLQSNYTQAITRAEFAALAVYLYETATGSEIMGRTEFNDTTDENVEKMGYLRVVTGVGDGNFAPNQTLTREQAATMLSRLATAIGTALPQAAPDFADNANIASWAFDAVGQMQATGIMGGLPDGRFDPHGAYTREQSIITVLRLFDILD